MSFGNTTSTEATQNPRKSPQKRTWEALSKKGKYSTVSDFFPLGSQRAVKQYGFIYIVDCNHIAVTSMPKWHTPFCFGMIFRLVKANQQI